MRNLSFLILISPGRTQMDVGAALSHVIPRKWEAKNAVVLRGSAVSKEQVGQVFFFELESECCSL